MIDATGTRVSYDIGCMKSLRKLPDRVAIKVIDPRGNEVMAVHRLGTGG